MTLAQAPLDLPCHYRAMGFVITHLMGDMEIDPPLPALEALYDELAGADGEHTDVSVADQDGWVLSAFRSGRVILEHVDAEAANARHRVNVSREEALEMFRALANGQREELNRREWTDGY